MHFADQLSSHLTEYDSKYLSIQRNQTYDSKDTQNRQNHLYIHHFIVSACLWPFTNLAKYGLDKMPSHTNMNIHGKNMKDTCFH